MVESQASFIGSPMILFGILGIVVLLAHLIAGLALLALAIVIHYAGKSAVTVLTCPACGQIDRTLR